MSYLKMTDELKTTIEATLRQVGSHDIEVPVAEVKRRAFERLRPSFDVTEGQVNRAFNELPGVPSRKVGKKKGGPSEGSGRRLTDDEQARYLTDLRALGATPDRTVNREWCTAVATIHGVKPARVYSAWIKHARSSGPWSHRDAVRKLVGVVFVKMSRFSEGERARFIKELVHELETRTAA